MTMNFKKSLSSLLAVVLFAAMTLNLTGCKDNSKETTGNENTVTNEAILQAQTIGEGSVEFAFEVVDKDGNSSLFNVKTDAKTVGEALLANGLIEGEEGQYGLYVKTVNGILADYDVDQTYWAFYIDGEYAMSGVDVIDITPGTVYSFKIEK